MSDIWSNSVKKNFRLFLSTFAEFPCVLLRNRLDKRTKLIRDTLVARRGVDKSVHERPDRCFLAKSRRRSCSWLSKESMRTGFTKRQRSCNGVSSVVNEFLDKQSALACDLPERYRNSASYSWRQRLQRARRPAKSFFVRNQHRASWGVLMISLQPQINALNFFKLQISVMSPPKRLVVQFCVVAFSRGYSWPWGTLLWEVLGYWYFGRLGPEE